MNYCEILFASLSLAFCWVHYINTWLAKMFLYNPVNPFTFKPFTCIKCMCGWFSLITGCYIHGTTGLLMLPAGVFTGAMFEAVSMRWL